MQCGTLRCDRAAGIGVAWCHCQSCRKHSGAPVSVFAAFKRAAYVVTRGEIIKFNSSPGRFLRKPGVPGGRDGAAGDGGDSAPGAGVDVDLRKRALAD
jgi:hypothetical protein